MTNIWIKDPSKAAEYAQQEANERALQRTLAGARAGAQLNVMPDDVGVDIRTIEWPNERAARLKLNTETGANRLNEYDYDHHKWSARLATHILMHPNGAFSVGANPGEKPSDLQINAVKAAMMLHDLGREERWEKEDPYHAKRSADLAYEHMKKSAAWNKAELIELACRLISEHSLSKKPTSPLLIAMHDAECFESCRLGPMTPRGVENMAHRMGQVVTPWAHNIEHQRRWRDTRLNGGGGQGKVSDGGIILP